MPSVMSARGEEHRSRASSSTTSYDALHTAAAALSKRILRAVPLFEDSEAVIACLVEDGFSLILCQFMPPWTMESKP